MDWAKPCRFLKGSIWPIVFTFAIVFRLSLLSHSAFYWVEIMTIDRKANLNNKRWLEIVLGIPMTLLGLLGLWLTIWATYVYLTKENVDSIIFIFASAVFSIGIFCLLTAWRLFRGKSLRKDQKLISPINLFIFGSFFLFNAAVFYYGTNWELASVEAVIISVLCFIQAFRKTKRNNALTDSTTQQDGCTWQEKLAGFIGKFFSISKALPPAGDPQTLYVRRDCANSNIKNISGIWRSKAFKNCRAFQLDR